MVDVQFEENNQMFSRQNVTQKKLSGIIALFVRKKLAKDEKQAKFILVIIAVVCFVISIYFFINSSSGPEISKINPTTVPALPDNR